MHIPKCDIVKVKLEEPAQVYVMTHAFKSYTMRLHDPVLNAHFFKAFSTPVAFYELPAFVQLLQSKQVPVFKWEQEMDRQGLSDDWRISGFNSTMDRIKSYPQQLVVPLMYKDDKMFDLVKYRRKGRIPVLTYFCKLTSGGLMRSAEPKNALLASYKEADYFSAILDTCKQERLMIFDMRFRTSADLDMMKLGGHEAMYSKVQIQFCDLPTLPNYHQYTMDIMKKCKDGKREDIKSCTAYVQNTQHLLKISSQVARAMSKQIVLVHGSHGWDRTSQVCSLAQLMLDGYYRTSLGFATLIEKDWIAFGHKFRNRLAVGSKSLKNKNQACFFFQFLDAVRMLMEDYPTAFEFTDAYLVELMDGIYSGIYGTFMCDSLAERKQFETKTNSLWTDLLKQDFGNYKYQQVTAVLEPKQSTSYATWEKYFA